MTEVETAGPSDPGRRRLLGWALGANDASNVFGTAVASRMLRFWTAAILCAVFIFLGAILEGAQGMKT